MKRNTQQNKKFNISNKLQFVGYIDLSMFPSWTRLLIWSLDLPMSPFMVLMSRIIRLWKNNGITFVVLYTKECVRILQHYVGGDIVLASDKFVIGIVGGIPSIIPGTLRTLIRSGDQKTIRGVLSLLSVYRVLKIPGKLKIDYITGPFTGLSDTLPTNEIIKAINNLLPISSRTKKKLHLKRINYLVSAGPNHSISVLGIWKDLKCWESSALRPVLERFILLHNGGVPFLDILSKDWNLLKDKTFDSDLILGKLSLKYEAAGKIRVFAITDFLTQTVMKPLSDYIFSLVRTFPTDGTFNQDGPLKRLLSLYREGKLHNATFYSYDLSSATDRLPMALQKQILTILFTKEFADDWASLLTDRDWYLKLVPYRYSVGQPMGALSSWAMLSLTHHVIVQIAAGRACITNFTNYAILGDDIVIADKTVALSYHKLMTEVLGVEINKSKSLVSKHSFEFAKRLITLDGEVSPVGAKNLLVGLNSLRGLSSILLDLVNKGVVLTESEINNMYTTIPTVRKSQGEKFKWLVLGPFGFIPSTDGLSASLKLTNSLSAVEMDILLTSITETKFNMDKQLWESNMKKTIKIICDLKLLTKPPGSDFDIRKSLTYQVIIGDYEREIYELARSMPEYRIKFSSGPLFTGFYRKMWMKPMMNHIHSLIHDISQETLIPLDPFAVDKVELPFKSNSKGEDFFRLVHELTIKKRLHYKVG